MSEGRLWRRCNACKRSIEFGANYWICNVSTCNRKRTGLAFCSVSCWEVHLPEAKHREAWAVERTAPVNAEREAGSVRIAQGERRRRRIVPTAHSPNRASEVSGEVLIVGSRLKEYIRARSGFNTSDRVLGPLSDMVRRVCDQAIETARRDGRRTVLDRDVLRR
jgi:hypothetical protein